MGKPLIVVRNQNNINFTTVDNYFIKDKTLSTKAKGLLIQLLALPDGWTFSKKGIQSIVKEGREFVENCMAELKEHGYLVIDKYMNQETGFYEYEYQIYAIPIYCEFSPDGNIINRKTNEIGRGDTFSLQEDIVNEKEIQFKQNTDKLYEILKNLKFKGTLDELKHHLPERLQLSNRTLAKMLRSLSDQFDKENIIWKLEKTRKGLVFSVGDLECDGKIFEELSSHLSSHEKNNVTIPDTGSPDTEKPYLYKRMNNKKIDIRQIEKEVDQNIDLDILYEQYPDQNDQKTIQNMRQIILDTMELEQDKVRLGNDIYPTEKVQKRLMKIKTEHIAYILNNLESLEHPIRNINAYLLKSLFTAPVSYNFNKYASKKSIEDLPDWYADTKQQEASPELLAEVQQLLNEISH